MASPLAYRSVWLWILVLSCLCLRSTLNGATIQLSWNPNPPAEDVIKYRLHQAVGTASFNFVQDVYTTSILLPVATNAATRYFVTAVNSAGESAPSNIHTNIPIIVPPTPPNTNLTVEAEGGTITPPFYIAGSGGTFIQQDAMSGLNDGGRASYQFSITNAGDYSVTVLLNAPSEGANSLYISMDAQPTDPMSIWDIPVTTGFQNRVAAWRGNGTFNAPQFSPKLWSLTTGLHTLFIRGREPGVQLDRITVQRVGTTNPPVPVPPSSPQNLRAVKLTNDRIDLSWQSDLAAVTKLERSVNGSSFAALETVAAGTQHTSTSVSRRRTYAYRAKSINAGGESGYSNTATYSTR